MAGWIVKYDGPCSECGTVLRAGVEAIWDRRARKMRCAECPASPSDTASPPPIDTGLAGGSARREYERLQGKREADLRDRWGDRVGGLINRFADEPQTIRAWGLGARGEELLGQSLAQVPGLVVLSDRRVAGTKGNIDHVLIAPAGVFVVDAKFWTGLIEVSDRGGLFRTDLRLTVGGRDKSQLADNMEWQVKAVIRVLDEAGVDPLPPISAVLCFVDGNWPVFMRPKVFNGVLLESDRSMPRRLTAGAELDASEIERLAHILAAGLPSK